MFRNYRQTLKDILKDISKDCVWFSKIWANVCWNAELVIKKCCLLLCRSKINFLLHGHWWEFDADQVKIPTLTMSRWQRVVFIPGRILFSAPRLSNSLRGLLGLRESSQGHIHSPAACRRMMWLLEDLNEFQGFLERTVFVFVRARGSDNHVDISFNGLLSAGCSVADWQLPTSAAGHWRRRHAAHQLPLQ